MHDDLILGAEPKRLAQALDLTTSLNDREQQLASVEIADAVDRVLATPFDPAAEITWETIFDRARGQYEGADEVSLSEVLAGGHASLKTLKSIRQCAKDAAADNTTDPEYSVAITLYFAAIANALSCRNKKITTYPYEALERSLRQLHAKPWFPKVLDKLFSDACDLCEQRK